MKLESAESAITGAWMAGLVVGLLTLIWGAAAFYFAGGGSRGAMIAIFANVAALFALAYGVRRKSKICAIVLALYFVFLLTWKTASWVQSQTVPLGILSDFIALLLCLNGARGVFTYHKLKQAEATAGRA